MKPLVLLLAVTLTACGGATGASALNGYWVPSDGGTGVLVHSFKGEHIWFPQNFYLTRLALILDFSCSSFAANRSGELEYVGTDPVDPKNHRIAAAVDGGWSLALGLSPELVNYGYRDRYGYDAGAAVGTVSGEFSGHLTRESDAVVRVEWTMQYRDSEKLLEADQGSFRAPRSSVCR